MRLVREKRFHLPMDLVIQKDSNLHLVIRKRMPMHSVKVMQKAKAIWILMQKAKGSYWLKLMGFPMRMVKDWLKLMLTAKVIERHLHWVRVMQKEI